jgi:hypothetical protein
MLNADCRIKYRAPPIVINTQNEELSDNAVGIYLFTKERDTPTILNKRLTINNSTITMIAYPKVFHHLHCINSQDRLSAFVYFFHSKKYDDIVKLNAIDPKIPAPTPRIAGTNMSLS